MKNKFMKVGTFIDFNVNGAAYRAMMVDIAEFESITLEIRSMQ